MHGNFSAWFSPLLDISADFRLAVPRPIWNRLRWRPSAASDERGQRLTASISVEVSPGELIDKITILEIKLERIEDEDKLKNVKLEWETLTRARDDAIEASPELEKLTADLKESNERLWKIEDDIRNCERDKDFGDRFVELARGVYVNNDQRSRLKRKINELLGSRLIEEKSYAAY